MSRKYDMATEALEFHDLMAVNDTGVSPDSGRADGGASHVLFLAFVSWQRWLGCHPWEC